MSGRALVGLIAFCAFAAPAFGQQPQAAQPSWANPDMWKSNSVSVQIETDIRHGNLRVQTDSAICEGAVHITAKLYTDHKGRPRKYALEGGNDDSYVTVWYYYDSDGALRKTIANVGAVNGTTQTTNFYFDRTGAFIGKTNDLISGPGFPSPTDSVIRDPRSDFRSLCGPQAESGRR